MLISAKENNKKLNCVLTGIYFNFFHFYILVAEWNYEIKNTRKWKYCQRVKTSLEILTYLEECSLIQEKTVVQYSSPGTGIHTEKVPHTKMVKGMRENLNGRKNKKWVTTNEHKKMTATLMPGIHTSWHKEEICEFVSP